MDHDQDYLRFEALSARLEERDNEGRQRQIIRQEFNRQFQKAMTIPFQLLFVFFITNYAGVPVWLGVVIFILMFIGQAIYQGRYDKEYQKDKIPHQAEEMARLQIVKELDDAGLDCWVVDRETYGVGGVVPVEHPRWEDFWRIAHDIATSLEGLSPVRRLERRKEAIARAKPALDKAHELAGMKNAQVIFWAKFEDGHKGAASRKAGGRTESPEAF